MTTRRIAHLSDVHLIDPRPSYPMRLRLLSMGRRLDAFERRKKLDRAFEAARRAGAEYFVLSGDLTELGDASEYEALAEALHAAGLPGDRVTIVPGNHDLYCAPDAWRRAIAGPLRAFAASSADGPGKVVEHEDLAILPVDCTRHQHIAWQGGELTDAWASAIERRLRDGALAKKALLIVQHHPPHRRGLRVWDRIDGLRGAARLMAALARAEHAHVMHGHLHYASTRTIDGGAPRIFGAPAIVEDVDGPRVRMYEVRGGAIAPIGIAA